LLNDTNVQIGFFVSPDEKREELPIALYIIVLIKQAKTIPCKKTIPLKSWLNKEFNAKKHTIMKGDNLKNK
jgi:hypothetical protein